MVSEITRFVVFQRVRTTQSKMKSHARCSLLEKEVVNRVR